MGSCGYCRPWRSGSRQGATSVSRRQGRPSPSASAAVALGKLGDPSTLRALRAARARDRWRRTVPLGSEGVPAGDSSAFEIAGRATIRTPAKVIRSASPCLAESRPKQGSTTGGGAGRLVEVSGWSRFQCSRAGDNRPSDGDASSLFRRRMRDEDARHVLHRPRAGEGARRTERCSWSTRGCLRRSRRSFGRTRV